jgi:hypothetical protein
VVDAITAPWHGGNYQARVFWENALNLLDENSCVAEVTFEANGPKSFDDVVVRYDPPVARSGPHRINAEYHQVKWHVDTGGRFGYKDFVDPKFIGAKSFSLLERLKDVREKVPAGETAQFTFVTTYRVADDDPLKDLISGIDRTLLLERLFDGTGPRGRMGQIRHCWARHLGLVNDDLLKDLLTGFRLFEGHRTLDELRDQINQKAKYLGVVGVSATNSDFRFDELARQLKVRKLNGLNRDSLIRVCREEGLTVEKSRDSDGALPVAIRAFLGPAADVSGATPENTLVLTEHFRQRYLQDGRDWQRDLRPLVEQFLLGVVPRAPRMKLILDAHVSIAFLAGSVLDVKSAVQVSLVQKGRVGARIWRPDDGSDDGGKRFEAANHALGGGGDIAVAVSVAQPVEAHVRRYLSEQLPQVGQLLTFGFPEGAGHQLVAGGAHAAALAEQVASQVRAARQDHPDAVAHIFAAVPNSMMFFLGQHHQSIAPCIIYEFDFDRKGNKSYQPSIVFE